MKAAHDRQQKYANRRRRNLEFQPGEHVQSSTNLGNREIRKTRKTEPKIYRTLSDSRKNRQPSLPTSPTSSLVAGSQRVPRLHAP